MTTASPDRFRARSETLFVVNGPQPPFTGGRMLPRSFHKAAIRYACSIVHPQKVRSADNVVVDR